MSLDRLTEWMRSNRKSFHDVGIADYIGIVDQISSDYWEIDIIKCRDPDRLLNWCISQWGEEGLNKSGWEYKKYEFFRPRIGIIGKDKLTLWNLVWT